MEGVRCIHGISIHDDCRTCNEEECGRPKTANTEPDHPPHDPPWIGDCYRQSDNTVVRWNGSIWEPMVFSKRPHPQDDMVNCPPHYKMGKVECIDAIQAALTPEEFLGYCKGNVFKYVWRSHFKGGVEDLKKARWYLNRVVGGAE